MKKSKWIWYPGEFELYHSLQLHSRREDFGLEYASMWGLANVYPRVSFTRTVEFERDGFVILRANCQAYLCVDDRMYKRDERVELGAGKHVFRVETISTNGVFPAIFIESDRLVSDSEWRVSSGEQVYPYNAACEPEFTSPDDDVTKFPFEYTEISPLSTETTELGTLVDFGRELFAKLEFDAFEACNVIYGETCEEASDPENAILRDSVESGSHSLKARAFRFVTFTKSIANVRAQLELIPVEYKAKFTCDRPEVEKIFDICAYTFHLCSREFLLDGIKRDRWCWSGDAYQSYLVNDYLFADRALSRRTITALYSKPPYREHINRINDYSALLIIGTWEYYFTTGDLEFIKFIWPRVRALYDFIVERLDERGLVVERPGDWIFIDWSDIDKSGPLCAEQILLWQVCRSMEKLSSLVGEDAGVYVSRAEALKKTIDSLYWDEEKRAYIDSFTSGRRNVTRHAAIFAIMYDFVDSERAQILLESVLLNDSVTKITTPYFELYELMALCKLGRIEAAQELIGSYWGGMVRLGATTIWEEFDPKKSGVEHYAMYGMKYGKSLCHAWGSGPVYLLGRYCAGVYPTSVGAATFAVEPNPGLYGELDAVVPIGAGTVRVEYKDGKITVDTPLSGGTLKWKGEEYPIEAGVKLTV